MCVDIVRVSRPVRLLALNFMIIQVIAVRIAMVL